MARLAAALPAAEHEKLDAAVKGYYRQDGDLFVLDIEEREGWALDKPTELKAAIKTERGRNEAARKAADILGDIDPRAAVDAYRRIGDLEEKLRAASNGTDKDVQAAVEKATAKLKAELDESKKSAESYRSGLTERGLRDELRGAIRKAAPDADDVEAILEILYPHVERRTTRDYNGSGLVVRVVGKDGKPEITGKAGSTEEKSLTELVGEMKSEGPFTRLFAKPGAEGFRGRTSPQPAGSRARTAGVDGTQQPERITAMDRLKAANEAATAGRV